MIVKHNPTDVAAPVGPYTHGIEVPPGARLMFVAGQLGIAPDGTVPADARAQADQVWSNIRAILAAAGMGLEDIVQMTGYVAHPDHAEAYRSARLAAMGDLRPASTLIFVSRLADPKYLIEIDAVAARA